MDRADAFLGHKGAQFHIWRREQRDDQAIRRHPFALAIHRVENEPGAGRVLVLLRKIPFGLGEAFTILIARRAGPIEFLGRPMRPIETIVPGA